MRCTSSSFVFFVVAIATLANGCCLDYWGEVEELGDLTDLRLDDVVGEGPIVAVGVSGTLIYDGQPVALDIDADLVAVTQAGWGGDRVAIVGEGGTLITRRSDESPWMVVSTPTSLDLVGVALNKSSFIDPRVLAVGDNVVVAHDMEQPSAWLVTRTDDRPWGSLNTAITVDYSRMIVAGDDGIAWSFEGSSEYAVALETGVDEDLLTGGYHYDDEHVWLLGEGGVAIYEDSAGEWIRVEVDTDADFIDFAVGAALTADGEIWDPATNRLIAEVPWARGLGQSAEDLANGIEDPEVYIVGDNGRMAMLDGC
jgi:hypothetical protein